MSKLLHFFSFSTTHGWQLFFQHVFQIFHSPKTLAIQFVNFSQSFAQKGVVGSFCTRFLQVFTSKFQGNYHDLILIEFMNFRGLNMFNNILHDNLEIYTIYCLQLWKFVRNSSKLLLYYFLKFYSVLMKDSCYENFYMIYSKFYALDLI